MTPKDFCNWFRGVLDIAQDSDGAVTFTQTQVMKIEERLRAALAHEEKKPGKTPRC